MPFGPWPGNPGGGPGATPVFSAVYSAGTVAADQKAGIVDANGGGVVLDGSSAGNTLGPVLTMKGSGGLTDAPAIIDGGDISGRALHFKNGATTIAVDSAGGLALSAALVSMDVTGGRGFQIDAAMNTALGFQNALAVGAVNGFPFVRSMPGAPTGVPAASYASNAGAKMAPYTWDTLNRLPWYWDPPTATWNTPGGAITTVATAAALAALPAAGLRDGALAYVQTYKAYFALVASTQPAAANTRIAASGSAGHFWVRVAESTAWWSQLAWFVDPLNTSGTASDENTGASALLPLLTFQEQSQRFRGRYLPGAETNSYTITLLSNAPDTDYAQAHLGPNFRNASINVMIQGTVTSVVAVGVITVAVAKNAAGNLANSVTVPAFDFSVHIGKLLRLVGTTGAASVLAVIEAAPALGVAQLSEQTTAGVLSAGFTVGQTVEIPVMTKLPGATAEGVGIQLLISDCVLNPAGAVFVTNAGNVVLTRCEVRGGATGDFACGGPRNGGVTAGQCSFVGRTFEIKGGPFSPTCGSAINALVNLYGCASRHHLASFGTQNATVAGNDGAILRFNGDFHCFGLAAAAVGIDLRPGAAAYLAANYYGSGNNAGSCGIRAFFDAAAAFSKAGATMDAGISCYVDGNDGTLAGGTAIAFAALPYGPSARIVTINGT